MRTADWAQRLAERPGFANTLDLANSSEWQSIAFEARPVLLAAAYLAAPSKTIVVTATYERALQWQAKLQICGVPPDDICQLPSGTSALFEDASPEHIALSDRLGSLKALVEDRPHIVLAAPQALLERTLPRDVLVGAYIEIRPGEEIDADAFLDHLVNLGYEYQEPVRLPGQFSRRGGIIDVYATGRDTPCRIELFGDQVDSIRSFDPNTQRSIGRMPFLSLAPSRETLYRGPADSICDLIEQSVAREAATLDTDAGVRLEEVVASDVQALRERTYFDRLDLYRPLLHPESGCAMDLLTERDLLVLDEPLELESITARAENELDEALAARSKRGEILHAIASDFMLPPEHVANHPRILAMTAMNAVPTWLQIPNKVDVGAVSLESYRGRAEALASTLRNYQEDKFELAFSTDQPHRAKTVLRQVEIFPADEPSENPAGENLILSGNLGGGFVIPSQKLALVTDAELFGVARLKLPQRRFHEGAPIATVLDLRHGDYVVHIHFGIGVFRGLVKKTVEGVEKEFLFIEYQAPDKLFVPADQLDRIQKYLNPGEDNPKLNRLTGGEWQRTLGKAKEEAKAFARDLVRLYAQRSAVRRKPYGTDSPFQHEMEATFPWVETPSQLRAISETKGDLEQPFPMDRLVCGDVGFGKTEVAIRAAFKAVQDGRQVAVLCPTTILSEQHFRNFCERLSPFGVRIALINRFTHAQNRKQAVDELKTGRVEIVVGTHSLLGVGIQFKQLGLVVIDEEQKFGVKQKEMLKELRSEVDVLTLSATPIPRTLSMALMDVRQMSLINDPPPGRLPIRTFVRPFSTEVVREAILRELARGGQVFYVYNRVQSIEHVAEKLRKLVPMARIGVGHGQMTEKEIEPIMIGFIKGEIDILLSTTIIESGIDIPNVNTLIVENADRLGLAQLYQLRGRVGRSDRQAYAYLLYQSGKELSEGALARLQALQEFSTLGSGYSLAFRDLQIRGAGELLGKKQSGAMMTVGFELYTQLINEAVAQLKNSVDGQPIGDKEIRDPLESLEALPAFEIPVVALIPDGYIKDQAQRLYYYQQMMSAREEARLAEVQGEIEDRYGKLTEEVHNAFEVMGLRIRARAIGIDKVDARQGRVNISFKDRSALPPRVFSLLGQKNRECYLTRESFIWPFTGPPLAAVRRIVQGFEDAIAEIESSRAALGATMA